MAMEKNFDAQSAEAQIYGDWESFGAFKAGANAKPGAETFCIMIPPPNVTGSLHMGHAFNNTLQDILTRWHRMRGHDVLWQPGTDHAGIATQMVTEREMVANQEPSRVEMGRERFVSRVWEQKKKSRGTIIGQLKRLGASCDWSREAFTMGGAAGDPDAGSGAPNFHDAVIKTFVDMYNKGLITKGKRLVNWDPHFETAISDLEVENVEVQGHMWHFKYPLAGGATYEYVEKDEDGNVTLRETRDYIAIATTRPETMLGDGAVAVHTDDARYAPIVGQLCEIPVGPKEYRRLIPIITDDYPDPLFGSGAVKITGAHDLNDYGVAKRNGIPLYNLMDTKAAMRSDGLSYLESAKKATELAKARGDEAPDVAEVNLVPEEYRGLDRFEARAKVVAEIDGEGLMIKVEDKLIMQPFGDRSKVVIEPYLTDQWFVDAERLAGPALEAVRLGKVKILPEGDRKVYFHWLENIEPWCISRQLWWGHQVPVWYGPFVKGDPDIQGTRFREKMFCASTVEELLIITSDYYGTTAIEFPETDSKFYYFLNLRTPNGKAVSEKGNGVRLFRDEDVLDTWFSSGLWPFGTLGWPEQTPELQKYYPNSTLITGFDIIFFWVARMIMMGIEQMDEVPFKTVYVHPLVRDENGKKMSKSVGNVIDPLDMIDVYGADAVRFTLTAMAAMGRDLKLSEQRIAGYRNFGTKLWNASRFAEMNDCKPVAGFDPSACEQTVNRWIVGETAKTLEAVDTALEGFRFNDAANALYAHVWGKVCDWYVELAKPLFQGEDEAAKEETRAAMAWAIDQCLLMLHPIMPFVTEQLWGDIAKRDNMLVIEKWPEYSAADLVDGEADREMNWVISLIEKIRSVRTEMHVNAGAKIPMLQLSLDEVGERALARNISMVMRLARVSSIEAALQAPGDGVTLAVVGGTFCLPLGDVLDLEAEKARLQRSMDKLGQEIDGLKGKLANEKFLANAPAAVVETQRERLGSAKSELATLQAAFTRIAALG